MGGGGGERVLSTFGRFNERGCCPLSADSTSGGVVGGAVRFRPIQRAGGGGGGGRVLSAFGRFNDREGGGLTGLYMYM